MATTIRTIGTRAMQEINAIGAGETPSADDLDLVLDKVQRLFDNWNAEHEAAYAEVLTTYTLTAALNPHTLGPTSATWTVSQRPVSLEGADIALTTSSPVVYVPMRLITLAEYEALAVPATTTAIPTSLYYEAGWPNGSIYLYPVPSTAYGLRLRTRTLLTALALTLDTVFTLPPGYLDATILSVAESLWSFGRETPPALVAAASRARARIFTNNVETPGLVTQDAGMPGGSGGGGFNYLSRTWNA